MTVSDNSGNPIPPPPRDSFQLHIGGQPVEIEEIRSLKDSPLFFSVLVDVSGSTKEFADKQIAAATNLFRYLSSGDNHGYLIAFKDGLATDDHPLTVAGVEQILTYFTQQSRRGPTALYDAIIHAATVQLASTKTPPNSRRAIFVFSDGGDNSSHKSLAQAVKAVQEEGIPVFTIGFSRSRGSESPTALKRQSDVLKLFNGATGGWGTFLDEPGDPARVAASLADAQCLILFKPPSLKPKKLYPIKIESSVRDIRFLAPKEYFVP